MITPWLSQKIEAITFPAEWTLLNFLGGGEPECFFRLLCIFYSGSEWWTHVPSWVTTRSIKRPGSSSQEILEISSRVLFWSSVNIRGTHLAETFDIPKILVRIDSTAPKLMPTSLAMLRRWPLLSHITRVCTTLTFSSAVDLWSRQTIHHPQRYLSPS